MAGYYLTVHTSSTFLSTSLTKEVLETIAFATTGWCLKKLGGSLATAVHIGLIPGRLARNEYCLKEGACILFIFCHSHSYSHSHTDISNVYLLVLSKATG